MAPISLASRRPAAASTSPQPPVEFPAMVSQLGREVASALSSALERVNALSDTGRIDREGLRVLREEIELARRAGMLGQQISRLASGDVQQAPEPLDLTALVREALQQRGAEAEARGLEIAERLRPACVIGDATLTYALLQSLLDWAFEHARERIEIDLNHKAWPEHAVLGCRFDHRLPDEGMPAPEDDLGLETMRWRLLHQTAATLGLVLERSDEGGRCALRIEFPRTVSQGAPRLAAAAGRPAATRPLGGSHVLVLVARREVRAVVREALRAHGVMIDFVTSVDEARTLCRGGVPQAIVHEAAFGGVEAFERLRAELLEANPVLAFVQIAEDGKGFEVRRHGTREVATVARAALTESLPAALRFEMARAAAYRV